MHSPRSVRHEGQQASRLFFIGSPYRLPACASASRTAARSSSSLNGLIKKATGPIWRAGVGQKFFRFIERAHLDSVRGEQVLHRAEDGGIVVHQTDFPRGRIGGSVHATSLFELFRSW